MEITFYGFCDFTGLEEDDFIVTPLAWADFIDQDLPLWEWWAEYQGDYV